MGDGIWSAGGAVGGGRDSFLHPELYGVYWRRGYLEFHPEYRDKYMGDTSHYRGVESKDQTKLRNWTTESQRYGM
jgi:hypothetical protein